MRHITKLIGLAALAIAAASCGTRDGQSPAYVVINQLSASHGGVQPGPFVGTLASDVLTLVTQGGQCSPNSPCPTIFGDSGQVIMSLAVKNIGIAPTPNNAVTFTRYHVQYRRADGRNTQGVDVPYAFDGGATGTVTPAGNLTFTFTLVRNVAKEDAPLVQLVSNGLIITTIADVTFYGKDQVGNDVSVMGSIQIDFGNFGDT